MVLLLEAENTSAHVAWLHHVSHLLNARIAHKCTSIPLPWQDDAAGFSCVVGSASLGPAESWAQRITEAPCRMRSGGNSATLQGLAVNMARLRLKAKFTYFIESASVVILTLRGPSATQVSMVQRPNSGPDGYRCIVLAKLLRSQDPASLHSLPFQPSR
jgi:hypothetical protein